MTEMFMEFQKKVLTRDEAEVLAQKVNAIWEQLLKVTSVVQDMQTAYNEHLELFKQTQADVKVLMTGPDDPDPDHSKIPATLVINDFDKKDVQKRLQAIWERIRIRILSNTTPNSRNMIAQAIIELKAEKRTEGTSYLDLLIGQEFDEVEGRLTKVETAGLFKSWCDEQELVPGHILLDMFIVLGKYNPKKNCFMFQGASNAGKTYWTNALLPFKDMVGQTVQSTDFVWQKCLNKEVILILELSLTKPDQVEEMKKIMEGMDTMINVKNKEPLILHRTPLLLCCNEKPWSKNFGEEKLAFRNRMYAYEGLRKSNILDKATGSPHPGFFADIFQQLKEYVDKMNVEPSYWNYDDPEYKLMQDFVGDRLHEQVFRDTMGIDFRYQLIEETSMFATQWIEDFLASETHDRLNAAYTYITEDDEVTMHADTLAAILLLISEPNSTGDVWYDITDYLHPVIISAKTGFQFGFEDVDKHDYDSFRLGVLTMDNLLRKMNAVTYPDRIVYSKMGCSKQQTKHYMMRKCVEAIKELLQTCNCFQE